MDPDSNLHILRATASGRVRGVAPQEQDRLNEKGQTEFNRLYGKNLSVEISACNGINFPCI